MAEDDAELIGGIAVSIGANHSRLVTELAEADRLLEKWAQQKFTIQIGAQFTGGQGQAAGRAPAQQGPAPIRYGAAATTGVQAQQGQSSLLRSINEALAKTGERLDDNGDVVSATTAKIRAQKQAVVEVQQAASTSTDLNVDTGSLQGDLTSILSTTKAAVDAMHELVSATRELAAAPPRATSPSVTPPPVEVAQPKVVIPEPQRVTLPKPDVVAPPPVVPPAVSVAAPEVKVAQPPQAEVVVPEPDVVVPEQKAVTLPAPEVDVAPPEPVTVTPEITMAKPKVKKPPRVKLPKPEFDEDEGPVEGETQYPRIQYVDQLERQRRASARTSTTTAIDINRSEASLNRQREREMARSAREMERIQRQTRQTQFPEYVDRSDEIPASTTIAPQLTAQRRAEIAREETARRAQPLPPPDPRAEAQRRARAEAQAAEARAREFERQREQFDKRLAPDVNRAFQQSARVRQFEVDEEQLARVQASRRAAITGGGQTSRTLASGLGALFGGTRGEQIAAQAQASAAARQLQSAERAIRPLDELLHGLRNAYSGATGATRVFADEQIKAIEKSEEYQGALSNVKKAVDEDAKAQERLNKVSSGTSVARNLAAITLGGAAFGIGLKAVDLAATALGSALGNIIDIQSGFGYTSTRVTTALAQQTLALHGNADAAIMTAAAQAGISEAAGEALTSQLRLTTQIKAGAQAQQQASELFRAGAGVGNAPTGLFGGYGGVLGTSFLAQQLGGGRGFSETVTQDLTGLTQKRGDSDLLGNLNRGLQFTLDKGIRNVITSQAAQQGDLLTQLAGFDPMELGQEFGRALRGEPAFKGRPGYGEPAPPPAATLTQAGTIYIDNLNKAAQRGAQALGDSRVATIEYTTNQEDIAQAVAGAAAAMDPDGVARASQGFITKLDGMIAAGDDYVRAVQQQAAGVGIADPAALGKANLLAEQQRQKESSASLDAIRSRQAFELPSIIGGIVRQQQYQSQTQLPVQNLLSALAQPNLPVGTGIAPSEQGSVAPGLKAAQGLQDDLNRRYSVGEQIIKDTYRPAIVQNFGQAAAQSFDTALNAVRTTGAAMASIQAGISNEQAAYAVAQYNFQLQIAKRSLRDIAGLTGANLGVEASHLGILQRENLELGRRAQLLQFELSQRQINFQRAVAGFSAPGVTPEERQANIKAAQIETDYAQRQLNIQREMFGNQVEIVDITNLRQGVDLVRQISLLQQGRQVTIDTAAAEQQLVRLQQLQAQNVARVGTYLSAVDNLVSVAFGQVAQLEAAAGHAMQGVAVSILSQFGIFLAGLNAAMTGGIVNGGLGMTTVPGSNKQVPYASGGVIGITGPTQIGDNAIAGEAGNETLIVLSRPRGVDVGGGGASVNFMGDIYVRSESDIDEIARKVMEAMGRRASSVGLRSVG